MSDYSAFYHDYCALCRKYQHYIGSWDGSAQIVPVGLGLSQEKVYTSEQLESYLWGVDCEQYIKQLIKSWEDTNEE